MEQQQQQVIHFLVVPCQAEGHINGMLRFSQALAAHSAQKDVMVTFAYPARFYSLARKHNKLHPSLLNASFLRLEVVEDGLPLQEDQPLTHERFLTSVPIFQKSVKHLLDNLLASSHLPPLSCIVSDTFVPWTQDLANANGLPRVDFWTSTASVYAMGVCLPLLISKGYLPVQKSCWVEDKQWNVEGVPLVDCVPGLLPFPVTDLPHEFVQPEDLSDPKFQFMQSAFSRAREAHTILVHSMYELESEVFDALQADGFPTYGSGPFLQSACDVDSHSSMHQCLQWLDTQPHSSVIYVALGSIAELSAVETHSLALALESCGHPFLWVIRLGNISSSLSDAFPTGFLDRTVAKGSGLIVPWAPQPEVLRHGAVAAFFSHCGWNSTLESIWEGVPLVACPRAAEQRSNARWIVDVWKMGVELERQVDGSFSKEAVEKALQQVFGNTVEYKEGKTVKEGAARVKELARQAMCVGGTSHSNLVMFVDRIRQHLHAK